MEWWQSLYDTIVTIFVETAKALVDFLAMLNDMTASVNNMTAETNTVTNVLGAFKYVVGDTIYNIYFFIMLGGIFYTIYVLVNKAFNTIKDSAAVSAKIQALKKFI